MKKLIDYVKNQNKLFLSILISLIFLAFSFYFNRSYFRIYESLKDLIKSLIYYFVELFKIDNSIELGINDISSYDKLYDPFDFYNFESLGIYLKSSFKSLINIENFKSYFGTVIGIIIIFLKLIVILLPFILIFYLIFQSYFKENENNINEDSNNLKKFKKYKSKFIDPIINYVKSFINYLKNNKIFIIIWLFLFLLYFNFFTIIIEFVSFYLYFSVSFDLKSLLFQFYKLLLDLLPLILSVPKIIWIILFILIFNYMRKKLAIKILIAHEYKNQKFIDSLGLSSMICGTMGTGKTTLLTDIGLSLNYMFRKKALELILENDLKFPNFSYQILENELKVAIKYHQIYNLATCKKWLIKKEERFLKNPSQKKLFDYDYEKYGFYYFNGSMEINLFEMLEDYIQLYFIYVMESSLLITNYSIREDNILDDLGNFPKWNIDFFNRNPDHMKAFSRHSHILDFDMLRLGKTVVENNVYRNSFEFGIVLITEGGKERGNMIDLRGVKKDSFECNQLNDLFNTWLKMLRHSATVSNYPFVRVIFDEQRPESLGADLREVCDKVIFIEEKETTTSSLMLHNIEEMFYLPIYYKFKRFYYNYRYFRSDNTLFSYIIKKIFSVYYHYIDRLKNRYGYHRLKLSCEKGTLEKIVGDYIYYISYKKIYSRRFATDAFKDYFMMKSINSIFGLNDIPEFQTECASFKELILENSFFINRLIELSDELKKYLNKENSNEFL